MPHLDLAGQQCPQAQTSLTLCQPLNPQVHPNSVPGDPVSEAAAAPAALVLGHDVRVRRREHAAPAGDLPGERPSAGAAAVHHDPGEQGGDAAVWVKHTHAVHTHAHTHTYMVMHIHTHSQTHTCTPMFV